MLTNDSQINFYDILQCYSLAQKTFDFFSVSLGICIVVSISFYKCDLIKRSFKIC